MRRLWALTVLIAMAMVGPASPAPAQVDRDPGAYAGVNQLAFASNNARVGKHVYMYVAGGYKGITAEGKTYTRGFATRGRCYSLKKKGFKLTVCMASWKSKKLADEDFSVDPALQSAALSLRDGKTSARVGWTGRGDPQPDAAPAADPQYGAFAYADVYRDAKATGTILGQKISGGGFDTWSFLTEGAAAMVDNHRRARLWKGSDGLMHLRVVTRVRS